MIPSALLLLESSQGGHCLCNVETALSINAKIINLKATVQVGTTNKLVYTVSTAVIDKGKIYLSASRNNIIDSGIYAYYTAFCV